VAVAIGVWETERRRGRWARRGSRCCARWSGRGLFPIFGVEAEAGGGSPTTLMFQPQAGENLGKLRKGEKTRHEVCHVWSGRNTGNDLRS
jgi:hypothetical protein